MLEDSVDEKYYVSSKQLMGMATTNYESYKISKLLKCKNETADTIKARFEGCPQMVSTGGTELQREVCDKALKEGLVKPNDVIEYTFSNARLKEISEGRIKTQNTQDNKIMSTLKTNPQTLGVTVEPPKEAFIVASRGREVEPEVLRKVRTEYGKSIRKDYEAGVVQAKRATIQKLEPRKDGVTNTTTTVQKDNYVAIKTANKKGYDMATDGDGVDLAYPDSKTRRGRVGHSVCKTLPTSDTQGVLDGYRIRKLTPKECYRLMGFDDASFDRASKVISNTQLYKTAGNSIVVNVLEAILGNLLCK